MENRACPCRRARAGGRQRVRGRQAGHFRDRRLGGGAGTGAAGEADQPLFPPRGERGVSRDRPRTLSCALLRHGVLANLLGSAVLSRKETHMAASDTRRPLHPALHASQKMGAIPGIPWDFTRPRVGIALCKTKAPFQTSVGLISLYITQHLPSSQSPRLSLSCRCLSTCLSPLFPAFLSEVSKGFSDAPTALLPDPCSGSKVLFALHTVHIASRDGDFAALRLIAGAGKGKTGQLRQTATVPATAAPRLCGSNLCHPRPTPSPRHLEKPGHTTTNTGGLSFGKGRDSTYKICCHMSILLP